MVIQLKSTVRSHYLCELREQLPEYSDGALVAVAELGAGRAQVQRRQRLLQPDAGSVDEQGGGRGRGRRQGKGYEGDVSRGWWKIFKKRAVEELAVGDS